MVYRPRKYQRRKYPARRKYPMRKGYRVKRGRAARGITTRQLINKLSSVNETKFSVGNDLSNQAPGATQTGQVHWIGIDAASDLPVDQYGLSLDLDHITQGDSSLQRDGKWVYIKKMNIDISIYMKNLTVTSGAERYCPTLFRCIVFKRNRKNVSPIMGVANPATTLFLNRNGSYVGQDDVSPNNLRVIDYLNCPTNRSLYIVKKDFRFTLMNSVINAATDSAQTFATNYNSFKQIKLDLPVYKKTRYESAPVDKPLNTDLHWMIAIFALPVDGNQITTSNWHLSTRSNLTFLDN